MDNETLQYILSALDAKFDKLAQLTGEATTIPIASRMGLGGIVVGDRLTINTTTGVLSADQQTPSVVSTTTNGLMLAADKVKLDSIEEMTTQDAYELFGAIFTGYTNPALEVG